MSMVGHPMLERLQGIRPMPPTKEERKRAEAEARAAAEAAAPAAAQARTLPVLLKFLLWWTCWSGASTSLTVCASCESRVEGYR